MRSEVERKKSTRSYAPSVEGLEALRLLSAAIGSFDLIAEQSDLVGEAEATGVADTISTEATWDAALDQTVVEDVVGSTEAHCNVLHTTSEAQDPSLSAGFDHLNRYLNHVWKRAGISDQQFEDCTQSVYLNLLERQGPSKFAQVVSEIGTDGIHQALPEGTETRLDFFRALDATKKRVQRSERRISPLEDAERLPANDGSQLSLIEDRQAVDEIAAKLLTPRESDWLRAFLDGRSPAEIAENDGVSAKTVSNVKAQVIAKLRDALADHASSMN